VEKLVYGGDAFARLEGRAVMAPFALPGERIRAQVEREKPDLIRASVLEVLEPSPARVAPECPHFGRCGGCHYQHACYECQLAAKRDILIETLRRVGRLDAPEKIEVVSAEPWGYRNRVQLHFEGAQMGYLEGASQKLCAIESCPVASPKLNETIGALAGMIHDGRWPRFLRSLEIFTDERGVQLGIRETGHPVHRRFFEWCAENIPDSVEGALDYEGRFRVSRGAFFQVNRFLADRLVETALEGAAGESALDLYAGVGLFAVSMARRFESVTAVESGGAATRDLAFNAQRAGLENVRAEQQDVALFLERLEKTPDFVLLDPPRVGLGKAVVKRLIELRPPAITLVACDPATMSRDVAGLMGAGYKIAAMTLLDLFPQTYHLETVVRLTASAQ
jgi:23S rRNA (uracil1939-C5)-methyltransferase